MSQFFAKVFLGLVAIFIVTCSILFIVGAGRWILGHYGPVVLIGIPAGIAACWVVGDFVSKMIEFGGGP